MCARGHVGGSRRKDFSRSLTLVNSMRAVVALLAMTTASFAGENAHFYGTWEPPPALTEFWRPVRNSWWQVGRGTDSPLIAQHCKQFAQSHRPEAIIPEMIADLKGISFGGSLVCLSSRDATLAPEESSRFAKAFSEVT